MCFVLSQAATRCHAAIWHLAARVCSEAGETVRNSTREEQDLNMIS